MDAAMLHELFEYRDGCLYWKTTKGSRAQKGAMAGHVRSDGYVTTQIERKAYKVHRLIFLMFYDFLPPEVDHINGNRTDNRIQNLRASTKEQNQHNAKKRKDNVSGIKGVCWKKDLKKWCARLQVNARRIHLGYFDNIQDAEKAVKLYRIEQHGEFARHA